MVSLLLDNFISQIARVEIKKAEAIHSHECVASVCVFKKLRTHLYHKSVYYCKRDYALLLITCSVITEAVT